MAKLPAVKQSLNGGELSPRFESRRDQNKYLSGVYKLENFIPLTLGGVRKRPGLAFIREAKRSGLDNNAVRVVAFKYSGEQVYTLEFGHLYIRFYQGRNIIESSPGVPFEITTTYLSHHLDGLSFWQSADVLHIVHVDKIYIPRRLIRTSLEPATVFVLQTWPLNPPAIIEHEPTGAELNGATPPPPAEDPPPPPDPGDDTGDPPSDDGGGDDDDGDDGGDGGDDAGDGGDDAGDDE